MQLLDLRAAEVTPAERERPAHHESGHALLAIMDERLAGRDWLVGDQVSLADICLYAYTHTAGSRGGFDMSRFPTVNRWLDRVVQLPGYVGIGA